MIQVMGSNPGWGELGVYSPSVSIELEPKLYRVLCSMQSMECVVTNKTCFSEMCLCHGNVIFLPPPRLAFYTFQGLFIKFVSGAPCRFAVVVFSRDMHAVTLALWH